MKKTPESKDSPPQGAAKVTGDYIAALRRSTRNRESDDEIAQLEAELRRAYIVKELEVQLAEREAERFIEKARNQHAARMIRLEQQVAVEDDVRRRSEDVERCTDYRRSLEEQMEEKVEERRIELAEARRERLILVEVDRTREEQEISERLKMKNELAERLMRERLVFEEIREIRRDEEREADERKVRQDMEYHEEVDRRTKEAKRLGEQLASRRERIVDEIAGMIVNVEKKKREREMLIMELVGEDVKRELLMGMMEEETRRRKMKEELVATLEEQIVFSEQCKIRFVERDRTFAEEVMRKVMEDEKTARLTAEAKRRMQLQYREELRGMIEERRRIREEEITRMEKEVREERKREIGKIEGIREERKRLLEEHASNVGDFINRGTLSMEERRIVESLKHVRDD